jgi:acid phosphatase (class B)
MKRRDFLLLLLSACVLLLPGCANSVKNEPQAPGETKTPPEKAPAEAAGFDLDDTLLFSSPAFDYARGTGVRPYSEAFWKIVNTSDEGRSKVKKKTLELLKTHQKKGDRIYVITSRKPFGGETVKRFVEKTFGIPEENFYFETKGKAGRMRALGLSVFYGDSDSDITAAQEAGVRALRIRRSARSSYKRKYNPGKYGEEIVEGSDE